MNAGTRVAGRYEVVERLATGGEATVYLARDVKFDARVALKVASATGQAHEQFKARFMREARIGHLLGKTPGIVRALDWGVHEAERTLYLVLDLVEAARPLDLHEGPRPARLRRLATAAGLVQRIHDQGVVHRDLKPENFLLDARGALFLADFGAAKSLSGADGAEDTRDY